MAIPKQGKGTGTKRQIRMSLITITWIICEHYCPECRSIWQHKLPPIPWPGMYQKCHLGIFTLDGPCIEYPNMYGKPLLNTKKVK